MRLRVGAGTDTGRVRELNEDAYVLRTEQGLFVVCDGMGGAPAGEVASQMAIEAIVEQLDDPAAVDSPAAAADAQTYLPQTGRLAEAVRRSNQRIFDSASRDPQQAGMGTTVVGAWIGEHIASVAHVGDSRAYLWHHNRLEALTRDHSFLQSNVLERVLGREPEVDVELTEVPLQPGDYLLLCSDGLTRMVSEEDMARAIVDLREPQRICDYLIAAANEKGGTDNITVVVVEVADTWWRTLVNAWKRYATRGHDVETYPAV
jgi:serine/threonine protein phosphatase PrpC